MDGKIAVSHALGNAITGEYIKTYYVVSGEPENIQQEEVDNIDLWERVEADWDNENKLWIIKKTF